MVTLHTHQNDNKSHFGHWTTFACQLWFTSILNVNSELKILRHCGVEETASLTYPQNKKFNRVSSGDLGSPHCWSASTNPSPWHCNCKFFLTIFHTVSWGTVTSQLARLFLLSRAAHKCLSQSVHSCFKNRQVPMNSLPLQKTTHL
jgi:hypothetical protein